jgi:hypothetical protein
MRKSLLCNPPPRQKTAAVKKVVAPDAPKRDAKRRGALKLIPARMSKPTLSYHKPLGLAQISCIKLVRSWAITSLRHYRKI